MSFYSDASLVLIPSGYKDQKIYSAKPTDGLGDLVFSRASSATRVASNGLIEKVRTNLLLQSNTFNVTWLLSGTGTITQGAADPFGGATAWTLAKTAGNTFLYQSTAGFSGSNTFSIFAKAGTADQLWLSHAQSGGFASFFDLTLGTAIGATGCVATIVSVGGGWFRCSIAGTVTSPINLRIYPASGLSTSGTTGNILIYGAQGETGDIATDYIATTTAVSVGPVSGLPRLDYLNSSCPRLLLEGQRTNLFTFSENFDNAAWTKSNSTITANATTSPDGYVNADKLIGNAGTFSPLTSRNTGGVTAGAGYTLSVFAKKSGYNFIYLQEASVGNGIAWFNLENGTVGTKQIDISSSKITDYGNGWYRCEITFNQVGTTNRTVFGVSNANNVTSFVNDGTSGILIYGAQLEAGAYATSYIPTLSTSVTRVADAASKTSISSLIGQTEGTLFAEVDIQNWNSGDRILGISDGTTDNSVVLQKGTAVNTLRTISRLSNVLQVTIQSSAISGNTFKLAVAYKANDFVFYVNGVQIGTSTSASVPACSDVYLGKLESSGATNQFDGRNSQALLFKTRLTNDALASLTTL